MKRFKKQRQSLYQMGVCFYSFEEKE